MAIPIVNDLAANPYVLAEAGAATTKSVKVASFTYCAPDSEGHVAELSDVHGRPVARLDASLRSMRMDGWVHGLTVDRLDSGYVLVSLIDAR